jgi:MFS family permease
VPPVNKLGPAGKGEPPRRTPGVRALTRLRTAVTVFFALDGFVFAGWVVRIPAVKDRTHASASALGLALLGVSTGAVITMVLTGRLCRRFGNHPVTVVCAALVSLSVALPPLTRSAAALGGVLLVFGGAYGGLNVAMNSAAVDVVAALRRPVMPSFHAAFSLGGMLGSGVGGLVAAHLTPTRHLCALALTGLLVTALAGRTLLRQPAPVPRRPVRQAAPPLRVPKTAVRSPADAGRTAQEAAVPDGEPVPNGPAPGSEAIRTTTVRPSPPDRGRVPAAATGSAGPDGSPPPAGSGRPGPPSGPAPARAPERQGEPTAATRAETPGARRLDATTRGLVTVFGLIALCTAYGEGALADWGALHLRQDLAADPGVAATGYGAFALAMTVGRFTGTALLERLGRTRTLAAGGATAAVGMLLGSLAPSLWAALLGFGVTGLGLANIFPVAMDRAGALAGPSGVALASTLGYAGMLLGPPAIGFMADWFSLPAALTSVAVLAAVAAVVGCTTGRAAPV